MDLHIALALVAATLLLVAIPGPNVALIVANTLGRGFRAGAVTVLGTTLGVGVQLSVVVLGLSVLLELAAWAFAWLRWAGVAYLLYLAVQSWRQGMGALADVSASRKPLVTLFRQGALLALINPKTLLFNAAFLPQFAQAEAGATSLLTAAALYLVVLMLGDLLWAALAHHARPALLRLGRLRHRLTAVLFAGAGIGLALARTDR